MKLKIGILATLALAFAGVASATGPACSTLSGYHVVNGTGTAGGTLSNGTASVSDCTMTVGGQTIDISGFADEYFGTTTLTFVASANGFTVSWNPTTGNTTDENFVYTATAIGGLINGVSLGSQGGTVTETVCTSSFVNGSGLPANNATSGMCGATGTGTVLACMTTGTPSTQCAAAGSGETAITPQGTVYLFKDIQPNVSNFSQDFTLTSTPEPGSLVLLGSGLIGLAGAIRRKLVS